MDVSIVIGANYGDEGKGVITDALAFRRQDSVVVMTNGGAQRGHTVCLDKRSRHHVFHHFGSGTFRGCTTYFPETFVVNPMQFVKEYMELTREHLLPPPRTIRHPFCIFTTPFDMVINQDIETFNKRIGQPLGTCGMGVWETIVRANALSSSPMACISTFSSMPRELQRDYLYKIRDEYCPSRFRTVTGQTWHPAPYVLSDGLVEHFLDDVAFFASACPEEKDPYSFIASASKNHDIIFENGQGLLLDEEYGENTLLCTPSSTGLKTPSKILKSLACQFGVVPDNLDVYYVSRPYLTRHGPGFAMNADQSCDANSSCLSYADYTNETNDFQGPLRQLPLDAAAQLRTIECDMNRFLPDIKVERMKTTTLVHTHVDQSSPTRLDFPHFAELGDPSDPSSAIGLHW